MPVRPYTRDQAWLFPPHLDEMLSDDHPVRFVAAFVDELDPPAWQELGVALQGEELGAPAYHPRLLLSVWLYGFMTGVRSSRKLEAACRESVPYLWLSALQTPDHNTLWRFYQEHRQSMRQLLRRTVRVAVAAGLIDLALQAVDGTKIAGNSARDRTLKAAGLRRLLERTDAAIADLEAQNYTGGESPPARLPERLRQKTALREKVREALSRLTSEDERINLTDQDATLFKVSGGFLVGYNAQAVACPPAKDRGLLQPVITAVDVTHGQDRAQLVPMLEAAEETLGQRAETSLADAGYHSAENLALCQGQSRTVLMPEPEIRPSDDPYHKDTFLYDPVSDSYKCPAGQYLRFSGLKTDRKQQPVRHYRGVAKACRVCQAFGRCTTSYRHGRTLHVGVNDAALRQQRALMATGRAKELYSLRQQIIEPVFGTIKEQQGVPRFLLRGINNVTSEWFLLATAFNLRGLARVWSTHRLGPEPLTA